MEENSQKKKGPGKNESPTRTCGEITASKTIKRKRQLSKQKEDERTTYNAYSEIQKKEGGET